MIYYNFNRLPNIIMTGKTVEKHGWSHEGRMLEYNLLVIFHSGECSFEMEGKKYFFRAGDVALVPQGVFYKPKTPSSCEYTFFHFDGQFTSQNPHLCQAQPQPLIYGKINGSDFTLPFDLKMSVGECLNEVDVLLSKCVNVPLNTAEQVTLLLSLYFTELAAVISKCNFGKLSHTTYPASVNRIIEYVQENYLGKFTLDGLCDALSISKQYCMRAFKSYLNKTVIDYVTELKMNHAVYLLRWTYMNVSEVADYLGFSDPAYFSRVFKKYYGVSPSKYFG